MIDNCNNPATILQWKRIFIKKKKKRRKCHEIDMPYVRFAAMHSSSTWLRDKEFVLQVALENSRKSSVHSYACTDKPHLQVEEKSSPQCLSIVLSSPNLDESIVFNLNEVARRDRSMIKHLCTNLTLWMFAGKGERVVSILRKQWKREGIYVIAKLVGFFARICGIRRDDDQRNSCGDSVVSWQ